MNQKLFLLLHIEIQYRPHKPFIEQYQRLQNDIPEITVSNTQVNLITSTHSVKCDWLSAK